MAVPGGGAALVRLDSRQRNEAQELKTLTQRFDLEIIFRLAMPGRQLPAATNLTDLNLSDNRISKIEGLEALGQLRRLNLACNQITRLEGLWHLTKLEALSLQGNKVDRIPSLSLPQLAGLPALRVLYCQSFDHSLANPVCSIPGYKGAVLQALPLLQNLDGERSPGTSGYAEACDTMAAHIANPPPPHQFNVPDIQPFLTDSDLVATSLEREQEAEQVAGQVAAAEAKLLRKLEEASKLVGSLGEEIGRTSQVLEARRAAQQQEVT